MPSARLRRPRSVHDAAASARESRGGARPALGNAHTELTALLGAKPRDRSQLVHGALTAIVLFEQGLAPAVIDFSPYWRPSASGEAVVVTT
jgi:hypothetical protein